MNIFPRNCLDSCQRKPLTFASAEFRHSMPSFIVPLTMSSFLVPAFVRWRSFVESMRDAHSPGFCAAKYFSGTTFVYKSTEFVHAMEFHFSKCSFNLGHSLFVFFFCICFVNGTFCFIFTVLFKVNKQREPCIQRLGRICVVKSIRKQTFVAVSKEFKFGLFWNRIRSN